LGILGPADLTTLILQPEPEVLKLESHISLEYSFIRHVVELVLNYLSDDNVLVLESSNLTLFQIMATREGKNVYGNITKSFHYLILMILLLNCINLTHFKCN